MSLLNFTTGQDSTIKDEIFGYEISGDSVFFKEYSSPDEFVDYLNHNLNRLLAELSQFDEVRASANELHKFMTSCSKKIRDIKDILTNLKREPELMNQVPTSFLQEVNSKIYKLKQKLFIKKMSPDSISVLSISKTTPQNHSFEEEFEGLIESEPKFNSQGMETIDVEDPESRLQRLKRIENAFDYVNVICEDLDSMANDQQFCLKNLETNYERALQNAKKGSSELRALKEHKNKTSHHKCVCLLLVLLMMVFTVGYIKLNGINQ